MTNSVLGTLDPTLLINDIYTVRLTVLDRGGNQESASVSVQVARDEKVGKFTLAFEDLAIPVARIPIAIDRVYDSRDKAVGDFGVGWRLDLQTLRLRVNREQGSAWNVNRSGGFSPTYSFAAADQHKVSVTFPDGKVEEFDLTLSPASSLIFPLQFVTASYTPRVGTPGTVQALGNNGLFVFGSQPGPVTLVDDFDFFTVYAPDLPLHERQRQAICPRSGAVAPALPEGRARRGAGSSNRCVARSMSPSDLGAGSPLLRESRKTQAAIQSAR